MAYGPSMKPRRPPHAPNPLGGRGFDVMLRAQRERIHCLFDRMAARRRIVMREVLASTGYRWEPARGNVTGSPGRGHYPRDGS